MSKYTIREESPGIFRLYRYDELSSVNEGRVNSAELEFWQLKEAAERKVRIYEQFIKRMIIDCGDVLAAASNEE